MKRIRCESGIMGWQSKLQKVYVDFEEFYGYCSVYGIHSRLGYKSALGAWKANPTIQGSINPSDLSKVKA